MIDLYFWPTPNGQKITIMLEESGLDYTLKPVNIGAGDQFEPAFLAISPNNRMPAIVDHDTDGGPLSVFESGAILLYLAEKAGQFLAADIRARADALQWLFWQMGGLGPMAGQLNHFVNYAPQVSDADHTYGQTRYLKETQRLLCVMERGLSDGRGHIAGDYSIADMACFPWVVPLKKHDIGFDELPLVSAWFERVAARPGVVRGMEAGMHLSSANTRQMSDEAKRNLFGQTGDSVRRAETMRKSG